VLEQKESIKKEILFEESEFTKQKALYTMIETAEKITKEDGITRTIIPFLSIVRHSHEIPITPGVMNPSHRSLKRIAVYWLTH